MPPNYGILLSRQWSNLVGGYVQLDLSYATILVKGANVRIDREPRLFYLIEEVDPNETTFFLQLDIDKFQVSICKPIQCKTNKLEDTIEAHRIKFGKYTLMVLAVKKEMELLWFLFLLMGDHLNILSC